MFESQSVRPHGSVRMLPTLLLAALLGLCAPLHGQEAPAADPNQAALAQTWATMPADFTQFEFPGQESVSTEMTRFLWYHFSKRLGNPKVLFNKEYLTLADMWLNAAHAPQPDGPAIQAIHREALSAIQLDREGYVHTHQHYSHAHEHGWPFPLWLQAGSVRGITAGWHFQKKDDPQAMGWVWTMFPVQNSLPEFLGQTAADRFELIDLTSEGVHDGAWHLKATGPAPTIVTPEGVTIDAFNAPFLQLRWARTGQSPTHQTPYVEWQREEDTDWSPERRVQIYSDAEELANFGLTFSLIQMDRHPLWTGKIKRMRIALAPGESDVAFRIDSFFTVYDTRHSINNPIFVLACWNYYRWTGDLPFLRENLNRMRLALKYQQTVFKGLELNYIRNTWTGHDSQPGYIVNADGTKTLQLGRGIGNNYYDLMPFGWDDLYATSQYYAATLVMARIEQAVLDHPGWGMPLGALAMDPAQLRAHAASVKETANTLFWNSETGRFIASIDANGKRYDYGYTFLNQDAIWYGLATDQHARSIMEWINGDRIVAGDTSTGADINHWRFGPRATTLRNLDWYGFGWTAPEGIPWGGQVQDGGAVLGFSFQDLWSRLKVLGPDNAWQRLSEIVDWQREVWAAGGYRPYYADGSKGTTLQGGGTAGGLGIDFEFFESSLVPSILTYGFMGLEPDVDALTIRPALPKACPVMTVRNLLYRYNRLNLTVETQQIAITVQQDPAQPLTIDLAEGWKQVGSDATGPRFSLTKAGEYRFVRP